MAVLATIDELKATLEWTLDPGEERIAAGALDTLSEDARFYGRETWADPASCPRQVHNLVLKAARRFMRNPDGYTTSRAGDETLNWTDRGEESGEAHFTDREVKMIETIAGKTRFMSAALSAWGPVRKQQGAYTVPVAGYDGEKAFPYFADPTEPY